MPVQISEGHLHMRDGRAVVVLGDKKTAAFHGRRRIALLPRGPFKRPGHSELSIIIQSA